MAATAGLNGGGLRMIISASLLGEFSALAVAEGVADALRDNTKNLKVRNAAKALPADITKQTGAIRNAAIRPKALIRCARKSSVVLPIPRLRPGLLLLDGLLRPDGLLQQLQFLRISR